jgi:hypothetical protein
MKRPEYLAWERILLDSGVIMSLLRAQASSCTNQDDLFIARLLGDLLRPIVQDPNTKGKKPKERTFCVSAVSISELLTRSPDQERTARLVAALRTSNVEFLPFDDNVAGFLIDTYHPMLSKEALNKFARQQGWPEHDLVNGREWVNRDLMILATAHYFNCDVVLTTDVRTFYPMAQLAGFFSALSYRECFEISDSDRYIFRYDSNAAERMYHRSTGRSSIASESNGQSTPLLVQG